MSIVLPPNVSEKSFQKALDAFAGVVGKQWVLATDEDRGAYMDIYAAGDADRHLPSAAVGPQSPEEVQAIIRIANEHKVPLWPISRGKNLGYGAAAPRMSGTVVLDLGRMKRILEVNERFGYCLIEPGVGFFDLFNYLQANKIPLWMSVPANAWGSVVGNALERGYGYTPYGDNTTPYMRHGSCARERRNGSHRHRRDGQQSLLAVIQIRLRAGVGPVVRAIEFRRGDENGAVADARARSHARARHAASRAG